MNKKIISLLLVAVTLLALTVPAFAKNRNGVYIIDEWYCFSEEDCALLHSCLELASEDLGIDLLYVRTEEEELHAYAQSLNIGSRPDQIMLVANHFEADVFMFGKGRVLSEEDVNQILDVYNREMSYFHAVEQYLITTESILEERLQSGAMKDLHVVPEERLPRVVDRAGLLDAGQEQALLQQLDEISLRQQVDVVVVTVNDLEGKTAMKYADDFFDYNGYGFGPNYDGILLLVSMADRDWWMSTCGYGITAFTDAGLEYISRRVVPKLSRGNYAKAFDSFAKLCDEFITQARTGEPYDVGDMPFNFVLCLIISLAIGLFTAGCVVWAMLNQLKSVKYQSGAMSYSRSGSLRLTVNEDKYLYSNLSSIPKFKGGDDSGFGSLGGFGGSSSHRSSSGRSHGGRGGKF